MNPEEQEKAAKAVDGVVRRFVARGAPANPDDMRQQAWLIAFESYPNFDPEKGNLEGYLYRAITLSLGNEVSRWLAVPSINSRVDLGRTLQVRVPVHRDSPGEDQPGLPEVLWDRQGPEQILLAEEGARRRDGWGVRLRRALASVLRDFRPRERKIIERQYGLDGKDPEHPEDLARKHRLDLARVYRVSDRFRNKVYYDLDMNVLDRELEELFP